MNPTFKIFAPMLKASMGTDGKMRLHGIASSTVKDRHGDTMTASALDDMERSANNNLTIFLNHEYKVPEDVAGSVERAFIRSHPQDPDIHDLSVDIVINSANERAVKAWQAIEGGTQLGLSIGAMIPDGGATRDRKTGSYEISHVELLETSLVGVPANPRSWVEYAVKSLGATREVLETPLGEAELVFVEQESETTVEKAIEEMVGIEVAVGETGELVVDDPLPLAPEIDEDISEELPVETVEEFDDGPDEELAEAIRQAIPTYTDATVNIKTPYADVSIDTGNRGGSKPSPAGASQEALASAPENEDDEEETTDPWSVVGLPVKQSIDEDMTVALQLLEPTVVASLRTSSDLLKAITRELVDTKAALKAKSDELDEVVNVTEKVMSNTADILNKLSKTPVGRRAVVRDASDTFAGLHSVYSEEFRTLLNRS